MKNKKQLLEILADFKNYIYQENRFHLMETQEESSVTVDNEESLIKVSKQLKQPSLLVDLPEVKSIDSPISEPSLLDDFWHELDKKTKKLNKSEALMKISGIVAGCERCELCDNRHKTVFGTGDIYSSIMLIGEGPGKDEDDQGIPFVGEAGKLLTKMLSSIHLDREEVYITNMVKCRPPNNRNPHIKEMDRCFPYLQKQIELIKPKIIVALGNVPTQYLLRTQHGIGKMRGKFFKTNDIIILPTYHPSALLHQTRYKRFSWYDLKLLYSYYKNHIQPSDQD